MNRKDVAIGFLCGLCLTLTLFAVLPSRSQPGYDPWVDVNDDGSIDMLDISVGIDNFMYYGDPTKNVTITNWPTSSDVLVWWMRELADGASAVSMIQHSGGFSTLHILVNIGGLTGGETVAFYVLAPLYNATHSAYYPLQAYTHTFTSTDTTLVASIDVPSADFYFWADAATGTTCTVSLSYYLTWA